jgi:hypothetical protein
LPADAPGWIHLKILVYAYGEGKGNEEGVKYYNNLIDYLIGMA